MKYFMEDVAMRSGAGWPCMGERGMRWEAERGCAWVSRRQLGAAGELRFIWVQRSWSRARRTLEYSREMSRSS